MSDVRSPATFRKLAALGIVGFLTPLVCACVALGALIFLPLPATLPEPEPALNSRVTRVLDSELNEIAVFREFETRTPVAPEEIPQVLKDAVVAAEDRSFYSHGGVDLRGMLRALWTDLRTGETAQGGSTITQQYVRQAYAEVGTERTLARKIREAILASQLDRQVDKDTILHRYLDTIYFGEGAYGVGAAANTYFRKPVSELTLSEAALLVGVIPAPSAYSPRDHPEAAERKRVIVLDAMLEVGAITPEQHAAAAAETIWLLGAWGPPPDAVPHTFVHRPLTQQSSRPWFTDYVRRWIESSGQLEGCEPGDCPALTRGGLTIVTTMDPRAQDAAEREVAELLAGTPEDLEAAVVAVEPPTGFVRAMVGGRDFAVSQVNTALRERQPGSSFKPIVLAEAFEQGITPDAVYSGSPYTVGGYTCGNYDGARYGRLTLRSATTSSVNGVFCRLIEDVTVRETFDMAARLGLTMPPVDWARSTPNGLADATRDGFTYGIATALGAVEASPLEMAGAYATFANHGRRAAPTPVLQILGPDGEILVDNTGAAEAAEQVISPEVADNVTDVLRGVVTDGTAAGRGLPDRPSAGKTGTAQEYANAWFVGYTPTLSTAVWMGYRDCGAGADCALRGIKGVSRVTGGSLPARTWQRFMTAALEGVPVTEFAEPAPIPDIRDEAARRQRGGFDPGRRRYPRQALGAGDYVEPGGAATVEAPTTTAPPSTTTSTTLGPPPTPVTLLG